MNLNAFLRIYIKMPIHYLACIIVSCFTHPLKAQRIELEIRNPEWKYDIKIRDIKENNTLSQDKQ